MLALAWPHLHRATLHVPTSTELSCPRAAVLAVALRCRCSWRSARPPLVLLPSPVAAPWAMNGWETVPALSCLLALPLHSGCHPWWKTLVGMYNSDKRRSQVLLVAEETCEEADESCPLLEPW